jgi:UDP-N-acetylmuramate dehydrogenase
VIDVASALAAADTLLGERLGERLVRDAPLASMTTYRVGGTASLFVDVSSLDELVAVAETRLETGVPVIVIGRGSNMLVADAGFRGVAISIVNLAGHIDIGLPSTDPSVASQSDEGWGPGGSIVSVTAGGGVALPVLARRTAAAGLTGFEWAVGVPGTIGGAVRMNAGGHGSDMAACLVDVTVFDMDHPASKPQPIPVDGLGLRFRASSLPSSDVVLEARLRLAVGEREQAEANIAEIVHWRREHQPGGQNCGSVFVNPVPGEIAAGRLIDELGLRGFRIGSAWVSEKHANFIQAGEGGSAADVRAVMEAVRTRVAEATGLRLRSEVRLVGFDDADPSSFSEVEVGRA